MKESFNAPGEPIEEVPSWTKGDEFETVSTENEINPETLESTMTFKNAQDEVVGTMRTRKDGVTIVRKIDPATQKIIQERIILPDKSSEGKQRTKEAEDAIAELRDWWRRAA